MQEYSVQLVDFNVQSRRTKGFILESGIQIGQFERQAKDGWILPMNVKFFTTHSEGRFHSFCEFLSAEECVEKLIEKLLDPTIH